MIFRRVGPSIALAAVLRRVVVAGLVGWLLACGGPMSPAGVDEGDPALAEPDRRPRPELAESLRRDLEAPRHPSDGGGRAWVEPANGEIQNATVGRAGRWTLVYEAGPLGVREGGGIYLQVSPFWGWSTPQVERPEAAGYTEVRSEAEGLRLDATTLDQQLLGITVGGRDLLAGERVELVYGAGPAGAEVDRFAEGGSRFWIAVDGDGDGIRKVLADSPTVDVLPGPPAQLIALLPSTARPGERVRLALSVLDTRGNTGLVVGGTVGLRAVEGDELVELPTEVAFDPERGGRATIELVVRGSGVVRIAAEHGDLRAETNPLQVSERGTRVLWGDLQNHSGASDGTGLPVELYDYARDVAALDVFALTDHDHWGMLFLDQHPAMWRQMLALARDRYEPGRFVTLPGFEWTHWVHGHRHVLFFEDPAPEDLVVPPSSLDPATDEPRELWEALRGRRAMTLAHHSAGGPIATDWSIAPDPLFEPVTEIVSVHGVSEAMDSPAVIHRPVPGNFVRDALDRGYRLGFLGSSDGHDGHPGLAHLASPTGGLAAILAEEATREAVEEALRARRVYATSGPRILLRVTFGGLPMGSEIAVAGGRQLGESPIEGIPPGTLVAQVVAPGALATIDLVRRGGVVESIGCGGERHCGFARAFDDLEPGDYLYLRAFQTDGGMAWSSPFFFVAPEPAEPTENEEPRG